jgi:hypothetical protein
MGLSEILESVKLTGESVSAVLDAIENFLGFIEKRKRNGFRNRLRALAEVMQEANNQKLSIKADMDRYLSSDDLQQRKAIWGGAKPQFVSVANLLSTLIERCRGLAKAVGIEASSKLAADLGRQKQLYIELTKTAEPLTKAEIEKLGNIAGELEQLLNRVIQNESRLDKLIEAT